MEHGENQQHQASPAPGPQPEWAFRGSAQSKLKSLVEIAVVCGGFCGWLGLQGATSPAVGVDLRIDQLPVDLTDSLLGLLDAVLEPLDGQP